jgi:hypothetical protein
MTESPEQLPPPAPPKRSMRIFRSTLGTGDLQHSDSMQLPSRPERMKDLAREFRRLHSPMAQKSAASAAFARFLVALLVRTCRSLVPHAQGSISSAGGRSDWPLVRGA